ncbi:hypothetical protein [Serratia entomophila]|jgi:hypothetical protein|uniref:hypothetical protein n=2 Tax=Serratia entomophila TaxID=42906 RepID=UPI0021775761|nr:hypothetical protein [Serratia entomophila]CAI0893352.1 Uncharacterised protein [Serratia entomophila]CAI0896617.1 Uncharacterised protein [Serratia entomophila]CAI0901325.1 Uncharacterised protein [Serratia entomophila]CAI0996053.1 Uncharacterised protein [Serratia entomophila]CAI1583645.1 Uncharacterised protein [Serratia entomophila]
MTTSKGMARKLTIGEIGIAQIIYKDAIDYSRVRVHNAGYFPFGLQNDNTAVTPNGEIYFKPKNFREDYAMESAGFQHWFIHEMAHVWQYQMKMNVFLKGSMSWAATYEYSLPNDKTLADYGMEQQASILADYFLLVRFSREEWRRNKLMKGLDGPDLKTRYETILRIFIQNPKNPKAMK